MPDLETVREPDFQAQVLQLTRATEQRDQTILAMTGTVQQLHERLDHLALEWGKYGLIPPETSLVSPSQESSRTEHFHLSPGEVEGC